MNDIAASHGGGLTVLKEFYNAVRKCNDDVRWVFLLSEPYVEETDNVSVVLLPHVKPQKNRLIFDFITGGKLIKEYNPSLVFSLQNTITYDCGCKTVIYVHQPIPFQKTKKYSILKADEVEYAAIQYVLGAIIRKSIKNADLTIVQTEWMKSAIEKVCPHQEIMQVYPSAPRVEAEANYTRTDRFFYPTSEAPYKNNEILIRAAHRLADKYENIRATLTVKGVSDSVIDFIGRVPPRVVYDYYRTSCLVFPSYIETFGYPLVEAMAMRSIILAANCEYSHELLDGYENAYFFDPFSEDELLNLMMKVANGTIVRTEQVEKKHNRILDDSENSWSKIVDSLIDMI